MSPPSAVAGASSVASDRDSGRRQVVGGRRRLGKPKVLARPEDDRAARRDDRRVEGVDRVEAERDGAAEDDLGAGGLEQRAERVVLLQQLPKSGCRPPAEVAPTRARSLLGAPNEHALELRDHVLAAVARVGHSFDFNPPCARQV